MGSEIRKSTCVGRYQARRARWCQRHKVLPLARHQVWWLLHNCVAHPWLGVSPSPRALWFHDFTSKRLNLFPRMRPSPPPQISDRFEWVWHNVVSHLAIGFFPVEASFKFHDETAESMAVPGWV